MYNNEVRQISIANSYTKTISPTGSGRKTAKKRQRNDNTFGNDGKQGIRVKTINSSMITMCLTRPVNKRQIRMN